MTRIVTANTRQNPALRRISIYAEARDRVSLRRDRRREQRDEHGILLVADVDDADEVGRLLAALVDGLAVDQDKLAVGQGYRGVHRVLGSVDGLKKFIALSSSPNHGLNFCQGTVSEMLKKPGEEIYDVIRYFGSRGRIFNVHFRNIKGGFGNFQETFPDNGDVDFIKAARVYKEVGYDGMLMPDHVPTIQGDTGKSQAFAYCFGYIQALIQLVNQES